MIDEDILTLVRELAPTVRDFVFEAIEPVSAANAALAARLNAIEAQPLSPGVRGFIKSDGVLFLASTEGELIKTGIRDGKDGLNGRDGSDGINGKDGRDGIDGIHGKDGAPGRDGIDGQPGKDGINGRDGSDGIHGKDGAPGRDGIDGQPGKDGIDGKDGRDGIDGKDGAPGEKGEAGEKGPPGEPGQPGHNGEPGPEGKAGPQGLKGDPGIDGKSVETLDLTAPDDVAELISKSAAIIAMPKLETVSAPSIVVNNLPLPTQTRARKRIIRNAQGAIIGESEESD